MQVPRLQPGKGGPVKLPALALPPRESSPNPPGDGGGSRGKASPGHINSIADARQSQEHGGLEVRPAVSRARHWVLKMQPCSPLTADVSV